MSLFAGGPNSAAGRRRRRRGRDADVEGDGERTVTRPTHGAGGEESAAARAGRRTWAHASVSTALEPSSLPPRWTPGPRLQGSSVGVVVIRSFEGEGRRVARRASRVARAGAGGNRGVSREAGGSPSRDGSGRKGVASGSVPSHRFSPKDHQIFSSGPVQRRETDRRRAAPPARPTTRRRACPARRASPRVRSNSRPLARRVSSGPTNPPPSKPNNPLFGPPRA